MRAAEVVPCHPLHERARLTAEQVAAPKKEVVGWEKKRARLTATHDAARIVAKRKDVKRPLTKPSAAPESGSIIISSASLGESRRISATLAREVKVD